MAGTLVFEQATPAADTEHAFTAVTTGKKGIFNLTGCNTGTAVATISVYITSGGTTTHLVKNEVLDPAGGIDHVYEESARKLPAAAVIKVIANTADVEWTLEGVEEDA